MIAGAISAQTITGKPRRPSSAISSPARRWQLFVERRSQAGWIDSGRIGESSNRGRQLDADQRSYHLSIRSVPGTPIELCELHAHRQHALHPCALLARRVRCDIRTQDESKVREVNEDRRGVSVYAGPDP